MYLTYFFSNYEHFVSAIFFSVYSYIYLNNIYNITKNSFKFRNDQ